MKKKNKAIEQRTEDAIELEIYRAAKPLVDSMHAPEFSENNPEKPTGMALRIINAVKMKLHEMNFQGDGTPQLSAAIQQNELNAAKNKELQFKLDFSVKIVHFEAGSKSNKAFKITPREFYQLLGIENNNKQQEEFKEQILKIAETPYIFTWKYTSGGVNRRGVKHTPFFFVEQHFRVLDKPRVYVTKNKEGRVEKQEINEILDFYVIEPGHICWLGADAPAEEVNRNKAMWINQAHFIGDQLTTGQKELFNFFLAEYQKGKAAAKHVKNKFNPVRKYEATELLKLMNIPVDSPSFKKNKAREMKRLEEALIVFRNEGWLQSWELSGNEVRIVFPSALLEGGMA